MTEMIYEYDGSFEGLLTCVFESYAQKEVLTAITCGEDIQSTLFPVRTVLTDRDHAARVYRKVVKLSPEAADLLRRGFLTCLPEREIHLYRLVVKLLEEGPRFLRDLSDETLYPVLRAVRHLNGEVHQYKGFVRFSDLGGVLGGEIEPKNRVLPLLRQHFCARYRNERFFLYDRTHRELLLYTKGQRRIVPVESLTLELPGSEELQYRALWQEFFRTVSIRERTNPRCQNSFLPKRYRGVMTEFLPVDYEGLNRPAAAGDLPAPGAPAGISAPGTPPGSGPSAPGSDP